MTERPSVRGAVAAFQLAVVHLLETAGLTDVAMSDLTIHVDGRSLRLDIGRLSADGREIEEWLAGFSIDPRDLQQFGTPVALPGTPTMTH